MKMTVRSFLVLAFLFPAVPDRAFAPPSDYSCPSAIGFSKTAVTMAAVNLLLATQCRFTCTQDGTTAVYRGKVCSNTYCGYVPLELKGVAWYWTTEAVDGIAQQCNSDGGLFTSINPDHYDVTRIPSGDSATLSGCAVGNTNSGDATKSTWSACAAEVKCEIPNTQCDPAPTATPTPTPSPTPEETWTPTELPTPEPTWSPTEIPIPTETPTEALTPVPTELPTPGPTETPPEAPQWNWNLYQ